MIHDHITGPVLNSRWGLWGQRNSRKDPFTRGLWSPWQTNPGQGIWTQIPRSKALPAEGAREYLSCWLVDSE